MCPLVASPNRGYTDYQRTSNFDTGVIWTDNTASSAVTIQSGVIDVSRFAYIYGIDKVAFGPAQVFMDFFADAAGSIPIGTRSWQLTHNIIRFAQYCVPCLGPYVRFTWAALAGGPFAHQSTLIASNRYNALAMSPTQATLIDQQAQVLAASTTAINYPSDYHAGPAQLWAFSNQPTSVLIEVLNSAGGWDIITEFQALGANTDLRASITIPPGAWREKTANAGAVAGNYWIAVTPSTTGST